jgi:lysophospholipase L1-like esterase
MIRRVAALVLLVAVSLHAADAKPITTVLIGDSTVADYRNATKPTKSVGWGQVFDAYFSRSVRVKDHAKSGESSKSFMGRDRWKNALADKPDWVFIQFGHNDQPGKGENRETDPATTYTENLRKYITDARAIGAKCVLVTPVSRRTWDRANLNKINSSLTPYVEAMKKLGAELNVPVIDLHASSMAAYEKMGPEKSNEFFSPDPGKDGTHFGTEGAKVIAKLVADEVRVKVPELAAYLK